MKLFVFLCLFIPIMGFAKESSVLLTGSSTVAPIMLDISQAFEKKYPGLSVEVQTGGSTRGIIDVKRGLSQLGMVSRDLKSKEKDLKQVTLAFDGLGIIINKKNPVTDLSKEQLRDIYLGKIKNWKFFGGVDKPIVVVHKAEGRSTLDLFLDYTGLKNSQIKPHLIIGDNEQGIKTVTGNPFAIAYVSVGAASYNVNQGAELKLVNLDGVKAESKQIKLKKYPILRTLNLVYKGELKPLSQKLVAFSTGPEVQSILRKHYVIRP